MGAVFALVFFLILIGAGFIGIVIGVIGLVIGTKRTRLSATVSKIITGISIFVLVIGILITSVPVRFFSFIAFVNSIPPYDFVNTDILIEEDGYQEGRFSADGVVYECIDLYLSNMVYVEDLEPVFSYKTKGFLNGHLRGNYYAVENSQGFDLVCDEFGYLFAPVEQKERVLRYYGDPQNMCGYYMGYTEDQIKLSDEQTQKLYKFINEDAENLPKKYVSLRYPKEFEVEFVCKDQLVSIDTQWIVDLNGELYYSYEFEADEYSDLWRYTLVKLPAEIEEMFVEMK